ncbi:hypothetical protein [Parachlamydia acanthamoebae]|uniref:hypothetical protein n=1 Tax=Parachlamydia acanthamoebae TaxID=83552 RepID=UPI0001C17C14|nr:hypothetical protein [Parachlamydia acanthamoebae]EFB42522.1 hypothetical protein pah_c004o005 [Parachlamydia acanthamoebae str. Hall's coccus]
MFKQFQTKEESLRYLIEQAVARGRSLQSPQTGFVHYFYHAQEAMHQTIPIVENGYFILALMRTKTIENIKEAKELLDRILIFQNQSGNFPIYLHEFPNCKDRYLGAHLLPIFYWMLKDFHTILGQDLKNRLIESTTALALYTLVAHEEKPGPYHLSLKCAAAWIALGEWLNLPHLEDAGNQLLETLRLKGITQAWGDPHYLGEILASLQMVYPEIASSPWDFLWHYILETWHSSTACYTGPARRVYQAEFQPQGSLYDLYLGYFETHFSQRQTDGYPYELLASLIQPSEDVFIPTSHLTKNGLFHQQHWMMVKEENYTYCFLEKDKALDPSQHKGYHLFRLLWGAPSHVHSFVFQETKSLADIVCIAQKEHVELDLILEGPPPEDNGDLEGEINFFVDLHEGLKVLVDNVPATTFQIENTLQLKSPLLSLSIQFQLMEGEGSFFGHLLRGNRPAQILNKGAQRYEAYDSQIAIRTIKRSEKCRIKVLIDILK